MIKFVELQEVQKTATGRSKSTSVLLNIDQITALRPTQHYKETSIALSHAVLVLVEGNMNDVLSAIREVERGSGSDAQLQTGPEAVSS